MKITKFLKLISGALLERVFQIDVIFTGRHSTSESVVKITQILARDDKFIESSFALEEESPGNA